MARVLFYLSILISTTVIGQNTELEKEKVKAPVDTFFEGFHKEDTILMKSVMVDKVLMQTVYKSKEVKDVLVTEEPAKMLSAITTRTDGQKMGRTFIGLQYTSRWQYGECMDPL